MRWRFVEPSHPAELAAKERLIARIDAWWKEFARRADELKLVFAGQREMDLPGWMQEHLQAVDEGLCWEFGPPLRGAGHRLVITAEGNGGLRPLVATLIERAPALPGWEFYPYRPRESVEQALLTVEGRVGRKFGDVRGRLTRGPHNLIELTFRSADFSSPEDETSHNAAMVLTESLLGEEAMDKWVGAIEAERPPKVSLLGRDKNASEFLALDRLAPAFDAMVAAIREGLPATTWREVDTETHPWTSFQLQSEEQEDWAGRSDLLVGITPSMELAEATFDMAFRSERFSRFGETFCYLKIDRIDGLDSADREKVERAIDEVLVPAGLGRTVGGGTGQRYSYVELALANVDGSLPVLRARLAGLPRRSWLLFHDRELADEWVGLHGATPPPPGTGPVLG